ncbi:hypothetical protein NOGI109294_05960 [Nocardiopsis gilva]
MGAPLDVGQHLAEHAGELLGHFGGVVEAQVGLDVGGAAQEAVVGLVAGEDGHGLAWREAVQVLAHEAEPEAQDGEGAAHGVEVGTDRGARVAQLGLGDAVTGGGVDGVDHVVDPADAAQVDEFDLLFALDDVVGLEVAVEQALAVQVADGAQGLQPVGDDLVDGQTGGVGAVRAAFDDEVAQRLAADVLHDDVPGRDTGLGVGVVGEVVDLDDVGVLDLGEEVAFGGGGLVGLGVAAVE